MDTATEHKGSLGALQDTSIIAWLIHNEIKNEKGDPIDLIHHRFLFDIFKDEAQNLAVMKAAQVGMSTCEILRNHYAAKHQKMDIIYTLPTDNDVNTFVGGKVNRIIANNPCMLEDVADKDSIQQKQVGNSMIYFRGTWTKKAAIMVTADRLAHDEKDSSKLDVVADYQARLQHSHFKQTHVFSHPSLPEMGVDVEWRASDQKHWFVKCENPQPHDDPWQYMDWNTDLDSQMSVDIENKQFVCKVCKHPLSDKARRNGQWVAKYNDKPISGYWVPLLIAPWITAASIIEKYQDVLKGKQTMEYFYNKVLGLPYADATSKLLYSDFLKNLTNEKYAPPTDERIVIGIDTGLRLDYVMGNEKGLFYHGDCDDYDELDRHMERWPKAIAIIDQGGDLIGSRKFAERWPGRVFLCGLTGEMKGKELIKWGKGDEDGSVRADRNRLTSIVVGEYREARIPVWGDENEWYEYYLDWRNLSRIQELDPTTNAIKAYKWVRNGRDHRAMATVFWRVGMHRFAGVGFLNTSGDLEPASNSYMINPDQTVDMNPEDAFGVPQDMIEKSLDAIDPDVVE